MSGAGTSISSRLLYALLLSPHKPQGHGGCLLKAGRTQEGPHPASRPPRCARVMGTRMLGTRMCNVHAYMMNTHAMKAHTFGSPAHTVAMR